MSHLTESSQRQAAERDRVILAALAELPGDAALPVAELAERLGLAVSTLNRRIAGLGGQGLISRVGERGPVRITTEGRLTLGAPDVEAGELGEVLRLLPCEAYRAMLRLLLAAVIARHQLRAALPDSTLWPSFIAVGDTQDGKSLLGRLVCRLVGVPERRVRRVVPGATPGEILGRTDKVPGGYRFTPSPLLSQPLAILDEFDKADGDLRRDVLTLLQGDASAERDGRTVDIAPVVYAAGNATPAELRRLVHSAYLGRSVVLSTWGLAGLLDDVDLVAADLAATPLPRLDLDHLTPPADRLPADLFRWLRDALKSPVVEDECLLTPAGRRLVRVEAVALLPLGLSTLYPADRPADERLQAATYQVLLDYLTVTATLDGQVHPEWAQITAPLRAWLVEWAAAVSAAPLAPADLSSYANERARRETTAATRRVARAAESDQLTRDRAGLVAILDEALAALDARKLRTWQPDQRVKAKALRTVLAKQRSEAGQAKTAAALDEIRTRARPLLGEADELRRSVEQTRQTEADTRRQLALESRQANEQRRQDERWQREMARQYRAQQAAAAKAAAKHRRTLESKLRRSTTKPDEDVLAWLIAQGVVAKRQMTGTREIRPLVGNTLRRFVGAAPAPVRHERYALDVYVDTAGRSYQPEQLCRWQSPATRAAITAVLGQLAY